MIINSRSRICNESPFHRVQPLSKMVPAVLAAALLGSALGSDARNASSLLPPCRKGTYPTCFPASAGAPLGWACVVKPGASKVQIGAGITWACGAGGVDCSTISGANPPGVCWDPTKSAADQDVALFGNVVFGNYYKLHCDNSKPPPAGQPCPGPGSPSAGSCDFGGVAQLVKAPVAAPCQHGPPGPPPPPGPPTPPPPPPVPPPSPACHSWLDETSLHNATAFRNVKAFGAKGDGVTDDTIAINAALSHGRNMSAMLTTQPAIVYIPPGKYVVSSTLQMAFYTFIQVRNRGGLFLHF